MTAAAPRAPGEALIAFERENLGYGGRTLLPALELALVRGERVALLGRSGAGKSTLLEALRARLADSAAWCPQADALVPMLSVYHNVYMGRLDAFSRARNLINLLRPYRAPWAAIATLTAELGLSGLMSRRVSTLSGGQRQRVMIARALYQQRAIFLGDEPVSSVDPRQGGALVELIKRRHPTCVIALHQRELALSHFDRIIGLDAGRIVLDADATTLTRGDLDILYAEH